MNLGVWGVMNGDDDGDDEMRTKIMMNGCPGIFFPQIGHPGYILINLFSILFYESQSILVTQTNCEVHTADYIADVDNYLKQTKEEEEPILVKVFSYHLTLPVS